MIVYVITNLINDKKYVGITTRTLQERWTEHKSRIEERKHCHLYAAMLQYGVNNFKIEQIDTADSKEELYKKEQYYIELWNWQDPEYGYNMTPGGDALHAIELNEEQIVHMYVDEKLSSTEIGRILGVSQQTIARRLKKHGIKLDWQSPIKNQLAQILEDYYLPMCTSDVCEKYNIHSHTLLKYLDMYNIKKHNFHKSYINGREACDEYNTSVQSYETLSIKYGINRKMLSKLNSYYKDIESGVYDYDLS